MKNKKTHKIIKRSKSRYSDQYFSYYGQEEYSREIRVLQGTVYLCAYKGAVLLSSMRGDSSVNSAWLRGEDFDRLIRELKEAKVEWLKTYRLTNKLIVKNKRKRRVRIT